MVTVKEVEEIAEMIRIYNYLGQLVTQREIISATMQVNISALKSGLYFIKIAKNKTTRLVKAVL